MRKSQRLAGHPPEDSDFEYANRLVTVRNSRRGLMGSLTRTINQILLYLNSGDMQKATTLQHRMMDIYAKFRAANTEYMSIETDLRKVRECEEIEQRETNRISEVEKEIRKRLKSKSASGSDSSSSSLLDGIPFDATSNGDGGQDYNSQRYFEGKTSTPFHNFSNQSLVPKPPSVSSLTAKPRSSFRRLRQTPCSEAHSDSLGHSSRTFLLANQSGTPRPQKGVFLQSIDKFIDDLIEGEETCLAGLSNPVTASAVLRYEFESKTLPVVELIKFNGESSKWPEFIENFSRRIHFKLSFTDNDRMERLLSVLTGEAKERCRVHRNIRNLLCHRFEVVEKGLR